MKLSVNRRNFSACKKHNMADMEDEEPATKQAPDEVKDEPIESMEEEPTKGAETAMVEDDEADLEDKIVPQEQDSLEEPTLIEPHEQELAQEAQMEDSAM